VELERHHRHGSGAGKDRLDCALAFSRVPEPIGPNHRSRPPRRSSTSPTARTSSAPAKRGAVLDGLCVGSHGATAGSVTAIVPAIHPSSIPPDGDDDREPVHQLERQLAAPDDDRDADQQAEDHERHLVLAARAFGRTGDGNHVVHAHHQVGDDHRLDGAPELVAALDVGVGVALAGSSSLTPIHSSSAAPTSFR
jgi:hypothetical protein